MSSFSDFYSKFYTTLKNFINPPSDEQNIQIIISHNFLKNKVIKTASVENIETTLIEQGVRKERADILIISKFLIKKKKAKQEAKTLNWAGELIKSSDKKQQRNTAAHPSKRDHKLVEKFRSVVQADGILNVEKIKAAEEQR
jgi:hypothetical protein